MGGGGGELADKITQIATSTCDLVSVGDREERDFSLGIFFPKMLQVYRVLFYMMFTS